VYAIDIVVSTGEGKAKVLDEKQTTVYKRALDSNYSLKLKVRGRAASAPPAAASSVCSKEAAPCTHAAAAADAQRGLLRLGAACRLLLLLLLMLLLCLPTSCAMPTHKQQVGNLFVGNATHVASQQKCAAQHACTHTHMYTHTHTHARTHTGLAPGVQRHRPRLPCHALHHARTHRGCCWRQGAAEPGLTGARHPRLHHARLTEPVPGAV